MTGNKSRERQGGGSYFDRHRGEQRRQPPQAEPNQRNKDVKSRVDERKSTSGLICQRRVEMKDELGKTDTG